MCSFASRPAALGLKCTFPRNDGHRKPPYELLIITRSLLPCFDLCPLRPVTQEKSAFISLISLRKMSVLTSSLPIFPQVLANFRSDLPLCSACLCKDVNVCSSQTCQPQISPATAPEFLLQPSPVEVWQQPAQKKHFAELLDLELFSRD